MNSSSLHLKSCKESIINRVNISSNLNPFNKYSILAVMYALMIFYLSSKSELPQLSDIISLIFP